MVVAAIRRLVFKPKRYAVPAEYGKGHSGDAVFLLGLIALLMVADSLFAASEAAGHAQQSQPFETLAVLSLPWIFQDPDWLDVVGHALGAERHRISRPCCDVLLPALLPAVWNPVPCRDIVIQRLLRKVGSRNYKTGAMGRSRRASGPGEIFRREEVRGLYLEAHAGFLFLRRLRALRRQLPSQRGRTSAGAAIPQHQGPRLCVPALSGAWPGQGMARH